MRTIVLCVNARLLRTSAARGVAAVRQVLIDGGCRVEVVETLPFGSGPTLTPERLTALSPDAVMVCGGDGTVFDALQSVAGTGIALGVIPFGTANILAQNLLIRGPATATAAALLTAEPRPTRLGMISLSSDHARDGADAASYHFLCAAGVGAHAAVMKMASRTWKRVAGKGAYWAAGLGAWLQQSPWPFEACVTTSAGDTSAWRVCEVVALRVGALNVWRPGGALDSSLLRLAMVPQTTRLGLAAAISRAIVAGKLAEVTSDAELQLFRDRERDRNRDRHKSESAGAAVLYQDVVRLVCRPLPELDHRHDPEVQADGEVLKASTTTIEMSDKSVDLLIPAVDSDTR